MITELYLGTMLGLILCGLCTLFYLIGYENGRDQLR